MECCWSPPPDWLQEVWQLYRFLPTLGLPRKQKIGVRNVWVRESEIREEFRVLQKECGKRSSITFFSFSGRFRSLFGHFFWCFCHFFRHFFAKLLLPDSFCGKVRNTDKFGHEFWAWFFWGAWNPGKQGRKIRYQNSLSEFAEKFAGTFPKIHQAKIKKSPQIRSAEPRAQQLHKK